ncbi:hypothetical protein [Halobacteriovorax sp. JY17]|uniref:hypothetical protein n=1 Tax=Halobacteriovorax sp. JY17 TaxID=2014617 RepID=UPI000C640F09|nr:hypothetical protein [Halobacteriovorax sp. JY17]PIK15048.1 MAG: hypothetical protein CES88_11990 [Halobacteriovorax sp. JY17]
MMIRNTVFIIFCALGINTWALDYSSNKYYDSSFVGEQPTPLYFGPISPKYSFSSIDGEISFSDDEYYNEYLPSLIEKEIFNLNELWSKEFPAKSNCPDFYLNENIEYIRYLYRLITISYLFESMKENHSLMYEIDGNEKLCSLDWKKTLGMCSPKSVEMIKFVKRAKTRYLKDWNPGALSKLNSSEREGWLENFKSLTPRGVAKTRVYEWLKEKGIKNKNFTIDKSHQALASICHNDKELLVQLCSERDDLYGLSSVPKAIELLYESNAANVINTGGHGLSCLKRYSALFSTKERSYPDLEIIFSLVSKQLEASKSRYAQGDLFLPGALKEFDDKGLGDFLFVEKKVEPKPEPKPTPIIVIKPKPKPLPKPVVATVKPVVKAEPVKLPEKIIIKVSAFEQAVRNLLELKLTVSTVNMGKMKSDFVFSDTMVEALKTPLKDYQTREALSDMKKYDGLGQRTEPMRLIFLKYLIENHLHQGLYNIVSIVGERFWLLNDIDGKTEPVYAEILNNESTNYKWQINILDFHKVKK